MTNKKKHLIHFEKNMKDLRIFGVSLAIQIENISLYSECKLVNSSDISFSINLNYDTRIQLIKELRDGSFFLNKSGDFLFHLDPLKYKIEYNKPKNPVLS